MRKFTVILSAAIVALTTAVTMAPAQAAAYKVTASISTGSAQSGDGPYMRGTLKPAHSGKDVRLQWWDGDSWNTAETVSTDSDGKFKGRISVNVLQKLGSNKFRAKLATAAGTGTSNTVTKTIYGWLPLAELVPMTDESDRYYDGGTFTFTVDGVQAGDDGWLNDDAGDGFGAGYTKWNLQEKCIKLAGFAGIDDSSGTGALGKLYINQDGTKYDYSRTFDLYEFKDFGPSPLNLHLTHYLSFKSKRLNLDESTIVGVGEPQVLCKKVLPFDS